MAQLCLEYHHTMQQIPHRCILRSHVVDNVDLKLLRAHISHHHSCTNTHSGLPILVDMKNSQGYYSKVDGEVTFSFSLSGGELFERITAEGYTMSEAEVINYMRQICEAIKHMHEKNIIHLGNYSTCSNLLFFCEICRRVMLVKSV